MLSAALLCAAGATAPLSAAGIRFQDAAERWGLEFRHRHGGSGERYMVETMVGGVVLFDYDDDGDDDALFVDGGVLPGYEGEPPASKLLRNDGGVFVDVTAAAGLAIDGYGVGGVAGDVDRDGDLDLYVTTFGGPNLLFVNRGDGTFRRAAGAAGAGEERWSAAATFFDPDLDGDLDLYVANYVDFAVDNHKFCGDAERGIRGYCHPDVYTPHTDSYFRNRGDGSFEDASAEVGLGSQPGAGLGVVAGDLDGDGWPDLYVANDLTPNFLFRNRGDGTFDDVSLLSGTAYSNQGLPEAGMGVDLGDVTGDGRPEIIVTNFELETNALYRNNGGGVFLDGRFAAGLAEPSLLKLAFGVAFGDLDNDGDLDAAVANGHINDNAAELGTESPFKQANQLFENSGGGRFREVADGGLDQVRASRGLALADFDRDGDLDLVVVNSNDAAEAYENLARGGGGGEAAGRSYLQVDLRRTAAGADRFGVGAVVEAVVEAAVEAAAEGLPRQLREVRTGSSYLSQNALTLHFGLGAAAAAAVEVRWPGGGGLRLLDLPTDRRLRIIE